VALLTIALAPGLGGAHEDDDPGRVHMTKDEALTEVAFPEADRVERRTLFLEPEQREALSQAARSRFDSGLFTVYVGYNDDKVDGYAIIDTDIVRTKLATYIVVLTPEGILRDLRVLAWQEPPEYQPPQRWFDQFDGRTREDRLQIGQDIDAISGATISARMFAEHVRRALAIHDVLLDG
jgi:Na+-translocating ferredoxin:NAD+ oxidoreductase RnfG subunit